MYCACGCPDLYLTECCSVVIAVEQRLGWSEGAVISSSHPACGGGYCLAGLSMHPYHPWYDCLGSHHGVQVASRGEMMVHF